MAAWVCSLCPARAPALLSEDAVRAHIRGHSPFFDRGERWRDNCKRICRICGEEEMWQGEMEEHMRAKHLRYKTFGNIDDIEEEVEDVAADPEPDQDSSQSPLLSPLRPTIWATLARFFGFRGK
jgi:hypothetical protein